MLVDQTLIATAEALLLRSFPDAAGSACAMYTSDGATYTGVSLSGSSPQAALEPETGAICAAARDGAIITGTVTLSWDGPGSDVVFRTPSGLTLDRLVQYSARDAQVTVHDLLDRKRVVVKRLRDLVPYHLSDLMPKAHHERSLKDLAPYLVDLSRELAVPLAKARFSDLLVHYLKSAQIRRKSTSPSFRGDDADFVHARHLSSITLRQLGYAFDAASTVFIHHLFEHKGAELAERGCNDTDFVRLNQGGEAIRNKFDNLLVHVETREPIPNEAPLRPYRTDVLEHGKPMHEALVLPPAPHAQVEPAERNRHHVLALVSVLRERGLGGYARYLHGRKLFTIDVFRGAGAGYCPFSNLACQLLFETADALEQSLEHQDTLLW